MADLVIQEFNFNNLTLLEADAFLDSDGDLRAKLTYLDKTETHINITTGKIKINDVILNSYDLSDREINVNLSIIPDRLNNLLTMETYE